jgi:hypothetical protein
MMRMQQSAHKQGISEVDPIVWTKNRHSFATLSPAFLTGKPLLALVSWLRWRYHPWAG